MPPATPLPSKSTSGIPDHLGREESALFAQIVRAYHLSDEVSLRILEEGLSSLQRARLCREAIAKDGMTVRDAKKQLKPHPLLTTERDSRAAALSAFKQLNLELPRIASKKTAW
jgi:Phage terminase, small subunit